MWRWKQDDEERKVAVSQRVPVVSVVLVEGCRRWRWLVGGGDGGGVLLSLAFNPVPRF